MSSAAGRAMAIIAAHPKSNLPVKMSKHHHRAAGSVITSIAESARHTKSNRTYKSTNDPQSSLARRAIPVQLTPNATTKQSGKRYRHIITTGSPRYTVITAHANSIKSICQTIWAHGQHHWQTALYSILWHTISLGRGQRHSRHLSPLLLLINRIPSRRPYRYDRRCGFRLRGAALVLCTIDRSEEVERVLIVLCERGWVGEISKRKKHMQCAHPSTRISLITSYFHLNCLRCCHKSVDGRPLSIL